MELSLLIALQAVLLLILLAVGYVVFRRKGKQKKEPIIREGGGPQRLRDGVPRRAQLARNRGIRLRANAVQENEDEEEEEQEQEKHIELSDGKIGAKKRAKLEAKAEKKAQREADEQSRSDKKKKDKLAEEERKKQEERDKADAKRQEEEEKKLREEKEKREYDEYLKMKEAFSVEEEGFEEGDLQDEQNLLQEFVNYIKSNKVLVIEDLAAHFKLKTQATIDRIRDLQNDNILSGVIDDRGKFIYISQEEIDAVAKFIRQRGRVSISELAENSNNLINLMPAVLK